MDFRSSHPNPKRGPQYLSIFLIPVFLILLIFFYLSHNPPPPPPDNPLKNQFTIQRFLPAPPPRRTFALFTAYHQPVYEILGAISSQTKLEYAQHHRYDFYVDNDLFQVHAQSLHSWQDRAAIRTKGFKRHLMDHDWAWWTDVDVLITNGTIPLDDIIDSKDVKGNDPQEFDMVIAKDWGGLQVQTGSVLIRGSEWGKKIVEWWEEGIAAHEDHDDLRGFELMLQMHPEVESRIKWVPQRLLNSYPHITTETYNLVRSGGGHDIWKEGDFVVHVVNCLRTGKTYECFGIAAEYLWRFRQSLLN